MDETDSKYSAVEINCNKSKRIKETRGNYYPTFHEIKKWCKANKIKIIYWREISPVRFMFVFSNIDVCLQLKLIFGGEHDNI